MEELKLILNVLDGATETAAWIAALWILKGYLVPLACVGMVVHFGKYVMKQACRHHDYDNLLNAAGITITDFARKKDKEWLAGMVVWAKENYQVKKPE